MRNIRVLARLDVKGPNLIKGVHLEGLRIVGDPIEFASKYYLEGADEILFMDSVASLYGRNHLADIIRVTAHDVFVPITVGGGIRSVADAKAVLNSGADKIAVNSAAVARPALIKEIAESFGSQAMVLSVEAKKTQKNQWEVYTDNGREKSGLLVNEWVEQAQSLGAGEVLMTSVDKEGTCRGFDVDLMNQVSSSVSIPVISSGGMGKLSDLDELIEGSDVNGIAIANVLHYKKNHIHEIKERISSLGVKVRL